MSSVSDKIMELVVKQYRLDGMWCSFDESNVEEQIGTTLDDAVPYFKALQSKQIIEFTPHYAGGLVLAAGAKITTIGKKMYGLE